MNGEVMHSVHLNFDRLKNVKVAFSKEVPTAGKAIDLMFLAGKREGQIFFQNEKLVLVNSADKLPNEDIFLIETEKGLFFILESFIADRHKNTFVGVTTITPQLGKELGVLSFSLASDSTYWTFINRVIACHRLGDSNIWKVISESNIFYLEVCT